MTDSISLPALLGGPAVRPDGPPAWPESDEMVRQALLDSFDSGSWGKYHGGKVNRLESELCAFHGCTHALTCASGTFAVELALRGLQIGTGDEVIVAGYDFLGNFLCVHAVGARPVLTDISPHSWNLCPEKVAQAIGPDTRAILASHLHGGLVPMRRLSEVAAAHSLPIIEDAAQCAGAVVDGKTAGTWGDVGVLSFGGSKLLSAGRGGAVLTDRADVVQRMRVAQFRGNVVAPMSELQAAVLLPQLARLDQRTAHRLAQVRMLEGMLAEIEGIRLLANVSGGDTPAFYKVGFQFDEKEFGLSRAVLLRALRAEGTAFDEGFRALHAGRSAKRFRRGTDLTEAVRADRCAITLHHPILLGGPADMEQIRQAFLKIRAHAGRLAAMA